MKLNVLKLFRDLMKLGKLETDNGILIYEGDVLTEGTEVFIEDENGNIVPAPDGVYGEYEVKDGKIAPKAAEPEPEPTEPEPVEQEEVTPEPEPTEPAEPTEMEDALARIATLEQQVADLTSLLNEIKAQKEDEEFKNLVPAEKQIKDVQTTNKGALKYFDK